MFQDPFFEFEREATSSADSILRVIDNLVGVINGAPSLTVDLERQCGKIFNDIDKCLKTLTDMSVSNNIVSQDRVKFPSVTDQEIARRVAVTNSYTQSLIRAKDTLGKAYNAKNKFSAVSDRRTAEFDAEMGYYDKKARLNDLEDRVLDLNDPLMAIKRNQQLFREGLEKEDVLLDEFGNEIVDLNAKAKTATTKVQAAREAMRKQKDWLFLGVALLFMLGALSMLIWF